MRHAQSQRNIHPATLLLAVALLLGGSALLMGCSAEETGEVTADHPATAGSQPEVEAAVGRIVQANFELVDALADDEPDRSRDAARQTLETVEALPEEGDLAEPRQNMAQALQRLVDAEDLAQMRRHFEPFSNELTGLVRAHGTGDVAPVYRAMCPMVEGRRAYWLQPDRPITNPYHGASMYTCGQITETLVSQEQTDEPAT